MPKIFQRNDRLQSLWKATHEILNDTNEKSTAAMDEVLESVSSCSDNFWDELAASDNESGQPEIIEIDEFQQTNLI